GPHSAGATRVNVGRFRSGTAANIIADEARLACELRTNDVASEEWLRQRAFAVIDAAALMHNCRYTVSTEGKARPSSSDQPMADLVFRSAQSSPLVHHPRMFASFGASDDASELMAATRAGGGVATYLVVGADVRENHHSTGFDFSESAMEVATDVLTRVVHDVLADQ
ncbi:MAG: hypothetical protein EON54_18735, partial [Alcaligenaceae bacterium]